MDKKDKELLLEFMECCNRIKELFIKEGFLEKESNVSIDTLLIGVINKLCLKDEKKDELVSYTYIIVYINNIYKNRTYEPFLLKHVTLEYLVNEAYSQYKYGCTLV